MKSTVFCRFEQVDMADIAIGKLRKEIKGKIEADYINDYHSEGGRDITPGILPEPGFFNTLATLAPHPGYGLGPSKPSRPVAVRITCDSKIQAKVVSKLVNLHAYRIVVM